MPTRDKLADVAVCGLIVIVGAVVVGLLIGILDLLWTLHVFVRHLACMP